MKIKSIIYTFLTCLILAGCSKVEIIKDTQGREFEKVRAAKTNDNGIIDIELWQIKGRVGPNYPTYVRLLGEPPTFTQTQ